MNDLFMDFLTILLPTYFFFYMAVALFARNRKSLLNRIAALLMLSFLFYFLGEYIKTSLLPQYQMQIVLYGSGPMLLLIICFLVHLCVLMGRPVTTPMVRWLPVIYASPFICLFIMLFSQDHRVLFNANVTDGRSPLAPMLLFLTLFFVAGYILLSVIILAYSWYRTTETKSRIILRSLLISLFLLFAWFMAVTVFLQSRFFTSREAMIFYFIGYLLWAMALRHLVTKYDILPDYRQLFHILFKSAPTAILLLDKKGNVKELNPQAQLLFKHYPVQDIPELLSADGAIHVSERLALFFQERRAEAAQWEISLNNPDKGHLDLMAWLEKVEESDDELIVMHLTDVTSMKDTERKLLESERNYKYLAHHDSLTGLWNRAAIREQLLQKIAKQEPFALVLIDLDNFKLINDTYGHVSGDRYLQHIAALLQQHAQADELIGRLGGDEFVMVIPGGNESGIYEELQRRLFPLLNNAYCSDLIKLPITFSAGVSLYPTHAADLTSLLRKADEAMYAVKKSGKHEISIFSGAPKKVDQDPKK
ncbi:GGDEF domain-containing protein [Paenibacillus aestuarii]|uniref:Diguanylate cyclase domain-containing protein n=1 Tax=Paenibacillus aestuarii TaxID=516965 RepID=A0ABW0KH17_9BACL|nr:GGDEF domain-containing protein [Paenibacillus aestuarii]